MDLDGDHSSSGVGLRGLVGTSKSLRGGIKGNLPSSVLLIFHFRRCALCLEVLLWSALGSKCCRPCHQRDQRRQ